MNKKKSIILLVSLLIFLILGITFLCIDLFYKQNTEIFSKNEKEDNQIIIVVEDVDIETKGDSFVLDENKNDSVQNENDNVNHSQKESNKKYDEDDVVNYFDDIDNEIENSSSFKEKFKENFITIVDFIFYEKEIKGYTFDELSGTAKVKIIFIALKIDNKIEEYIPGYKESILDSSGNIYTDIKEKLVTLYMDISTDICSNGNKADCDRVKEIFGEIKSVCKIGWDFIKNLIKNGVSKVREWYEVYSGK